MVYSTHMAGLVVKVLLQHLKVPGSSTRVGLSVYKYVRIVASKFGYNKKSGVRKRDYQIFVSIRSLTMNKKTRTRLHACS